jgi:putative transposase
MPHERMLARGLQVKVALGRVSLVVDDGDRKLSQRRVGRLFFLGKIERWHQTLKNHILLENYYLPGDLEAQIEAFVTDYNHLRYHEAIDNLTPADAYFGRGQTILIQRERIKRQTIANRRLLHRQQAA